LDLEQMLKQPAPRRRFMHALGGHNGGKIRRYSFSIEIDYSRFLRGFHNLQRILCHAAENDGRL
ncbi:MAG: hypothetical protein VXV74_05575, partial [Pseudomonadota bacterium]|nr:hypothetical protein [Pseudomonadota bacterium]